MEKKDNSPAISKSYARKMETISPFELKNKLIDMADESIKKIAHTMLNAGRGNPNWIATEPREAFFLLGQFGLCECRRAFSLDEGIAGIPQKAGIAARFEAFLKDNEKAAGANLLKEGYNYMLMEHAGQACSRMGGIRYRRPISCARPYLAFHGTDSTGLSGTGNVRPPSAERNFRPFRH